MIPAEREPHAGEPALTQASVLRFNGDIPGAMKILEPLYAAEPSNPNVWREMAAVFVTAKDYERAASILTAIHEAEPLNPEPCYQLAALYDTTGQWGWAMSWAKRAVERLAFDQRGAILACALAGEIAYKLGDDRYAKEAWNAALYMGATDSTSRFAQAEILLAQKQWGLGWRMFEYRWQVAEQWRIQKRHQTKPEHLAPEWDGKAEGRVAVFSEQGSGDTLQFARYLPHVPDAILVCQPELVTFMQRWMPTLTVVPNGTRVESEWSVPIMSLPYHLKLYAPIGVPAYPYTPRARYYGCECDQCKDSGAFSGEPQDTLRVGICWKGSPDHGNDKDRSYPGDLRQELSDLPVDLVSLQHGEPTTFRDYAATADAIESCDLVVSVDTACAHVAGTLGVPTIVLPPVRPEFRYPRADGEQCCWYPSVTCYRREKATEWGPVIQRVRADILRRAQCQA